MIDIHLHTIYSDGKLRPAEMVAMAADAGVNVAAITDHDTVTGLDEAFTAAHDAGLRLISGIEFSTERGKKEYHILGYGFDHHHPVIEKLTRDITEGRCDRARKIVQLLQQLGIDIAYGELQPPAGGVIGRMHIARLLLKKGVVPDLEEAFIRYLRIGCPAYVSHYAISPFVILEAIREAGGLAVWAHPMYSRDDDILPELLAAGLRGIEVYHRDHPVAVRQHYHAMAEQHALLMTGGSDWHGDGSYAEYLRGFAVPPAQVERFLDEVGQQAPAAPTAAPVGG